MEHTSAASQRWFRRPRALLALIFLASAMGVAAIFQRGEPSPWPLPTLIGLFYAAQYLPRAWAIGGSLFASAAFFGASAAVVSEGALSPKAMLLFQVPLIVGAIGIAIGTQRDYRIAAEERALRAEESRDNDARRRVADERLRIARDLHDVIAHHMAVIKVQSSAAQHLLRSNPDAAEEALTTVVDSSRDVLEELHVMVGVLRAEPDGRDESMRPAPGLGQLDALVAQTSAAGLDVTRRDSGAARPLSPTLDLVAYRIVQEALTNAGVELTLLDYGSESFATGALVTSAHISKGLEFDAVIVPGVDAGTYATPMDKSMLYIACTRAMHELHLSHVGKPTGFLAFAEGGAR
ncbi:MAG: hypothetical protein CVT68_07990 [Actinobacteria bacterium HGW-Actinobacteria-8]|nr:MAG: hypothetical protein CVT68_07990 [Actinobacteria bacterium HGW-Actinobacteria-8]